VCACARVQPEENRCGFEGLLFRGDLTSNGGKRIMDLEGKQRRVTASWGVLRQGQVLCAPHLVRTNPCSQYRSTWGTYALPLHLPRDQMTRAAVVLTARRVTVRRYDGDLSKPLSVGFTTRDGTAVAGVDYESTHVSRRGGAAMPPA